MKINNHYKCFFVYIEYLIQFGIKIDVPFK